MHHVLYWNDERLERKKPYWIKDVHDRRLLDHLQRDTNLQRCFEDSLAYADEHFRAVHGTVLDVGAGVCWTTALVSRWPCVEKVHALDYSEHRLFKIAPLVFQQLDAAQEKIERHCQSMSPLPYPDESADLVIFCQALYMAEQPEEVLRDVYRVLQPGGVVLVSCEKIEASGSWTRRWRRHAAILLREPMRNWRRSLTGRLPDVSGRYPYFDSQYATFITCAGFRFIRQQLDYPVFKDSPVLAANYFGVKECRQGG